MQLAALSLVALLLSASPLPRQEPPIAAVDTWGLRSVDRATVVAALGWALGDISELDRDAALARLQALEGVAEVSLMEMLGPGERIVMVGIREVGRPQRRLLPEPDGDARLDPALVAAYDRSMELLGEAIEAGVWGEDHVDGYSLSKYEQRRAVELQAVAIAQRQTATVARTLRESADAHHRAAAAWALAFGADKALVARELARAASDPDSSVRNNATRALGVLVDHAIAHPELELSIDPEPFVQMLDSIEWTDLNKASFLLLSLTARHDEVLYAELRATALDGLADIARWSSKGHAYPAVVTLGRLAGVDDETIRARIAEASGVDDRRALAEEFLARAEAGATAARR
ncbi:hypothetical protein [Engelhardtia mirabilis]|uniref:HEAT repeat protein n=1 Tax=Engelhardtia mirabilis TaxID=2528011 RepID=A0A518BIP8_9BACT|nr:hypothetical protein Pla133_19110 [Planctomycetes bacterium Pla133]QDV01161.1 hypothetical protein Pla86_19100 [Planctomycetes bacterium Pla86]